MEDTAKTLEVLNDLILINNDRIEGYEHAITELRDNDGFEEIEPVFLRLIDDSRRYKMELGTEVQALSWDMAEGTTASGKLHRAWTAVKEAFTGFNVHNVLEECEQREDAIKKAYQDALTGEVLPAYIIEMLDEQLSEIDEAHDEIKSLRDSVH